MNSLTKLIMSILTIGYVFTAFAFTQAKPEDPEKAKVYYFHNTTRCETCRAIETEALNALKENFANQMEDGIVTFEVYNFDDNKNKEIIKKLKVEGQALFIIKDGKKTDLTDKGFLFARTDAEKFKEIVKKAIGDL